MLYLFNCFHNQFVFNMLKCLTACFCPLSGLSPPKKKAPFVRSVPPGVPGARYLGYDRHGPGRVGTTRRS